MPSPEKDGNITPGNTLKDANITFGGPDEPTLHPSSPLEEQKKEPVESSSTSIRALKNALYKKGIFLMTCEICR